MYGKCTLQSICHCCGTLPLPVAELYLESINNAFFLVQKFIFLQFAVFLEYGMEGSSIYRIPTPNLVKKKY